MSSFVCLFSEFVLESFSVSILFWLSCSSVLSWLVSWFSVSSVISVASELSYVTVGSWTFLNLDVSSIVQVDVWES